MTGIDKQDDKRRAEELRECPIPGCGGVGRRGMDGRNSVIAGIERLADKQFFDALKTVGVDGVLKKYPTVEAELEDARAEIDRLKAIIYNVRIQAQGWALEARAQRGTVYRIYEIVTGKTGEPGDWNGEAPVQEEIARLNAVIRAIACAADNAGYCTVGNNVCHQDVAVSCEQCIIEHFTKKVQEANDAIH